VIPNPKHEHPAKIIRWIDPDTVDLEVSLDYMMVGRPLRHRLLWLDSPDKNPEREKAAMDWINAICPAGSRILIRSYKDVGDKDSFGRWLAEIYVPGALEPNLSMNEYMLMNGLADPYMQGLRTVEQIAEPMPDTQQAWLQLTAAASRLGFAAAEFQNARDAYVKTDPYGRSADA
jgi:endonuclease YncB( thermonuclease family)